MSEKLFYALEYRDLNLLRTHSEKSGNVLSFKINESGLVPVEDDEDCDLSIGRSAIYIYSGLPSTRKLRHINSKHTDTVDSNEIKPYGDIFRLLLQIQELEALNDEELWSLSEQAIQHRYLAGDKVFNEGDSGESLFVVASGTFRAITETDNGETTTLRILGSGQCFGEMSLLTGEPRSASVVADEDSIAYEINKHHLSSIMQKNPRLIEVLSELMADRHSATQQQALLQALAAENNRAAGNLMKKMRDFFWIKKNLIKPKTQNFKKIKISSINNINIYNLQSIEEKMEINSETLENGVLRVSLSGRLDVLGAQNIDIKFTALTATKKASILVDISEVSFLASLGMRTLISSAKALSHRGGFMVLYKPQPNVAEVLETAGVTSLIPVYDDYENAINALLLHQDN